jgi:hypothetical protein
MVHGILSIIYLAFHCFMLVDSMSTTLLHLLSFCSRSIQTVRFLLESLREAGGSGAKKEEPEGIALAVLTTLPQDSSPGEGNPHVSDPTSSSSSSSSSKVTAMAAASSSSCLHVLQALAMAWYAHVTDPHIILPFYSGPEEHRHCGQRAPDHALSRGTKREGEASSPRAGARPPPFPDIR